MSSNTSKIRSILVDEIERDIVGPRDPEEQIRISPTGKYLSGVLYPRNNRLQTEEDESQDTNTKDDTQTETLKINLENSQGSIPSSMGMSCTVSLDAKEISLEISYGKYYQEKIESEKKIYLPWKRKPFFYTEIIELKAGKNTKILDEKSVELRYNIKKFDKTTFEFNKIIDLFPIFVHSFNLIKFEKDVTVIQTILYFNTHLDLYQIAEEAKNINFAKIAYYLIGNLCWLILSTIRYRELQTLKNDKEEYKRLKKTSVNVMPKGIMMFGKVFSQEISDLLDIHSKLVNQIIK